MKKLARGTVVAILFVATTAWATWYGETKYNGQVEGHVDIVTNPDDCHTQSTGSGGYHCGEVNGMVHGHYYYYIRGTKTINGQFHQGKNWVQDYYDRNVPKTGLTINLIPFDD